MINKYAIVHGHFYQPPRENPWTGEIERQVSASPFHNWNERITAECYTPNTASRVLNETNLINEIVNNFQYFSFNFGPTLIQWIEKYTPQTYKNILEADKISAGIQNGHGNSIAQVYNHTILPLATDDDKRTQIEWGIKDFVFRFGRYPEGIWLAETAIDSATARILMEYKLKYIILSPHQAQRIRLFKSKSWIDVSSGNIDTRVPYRIYYKNEKGHTVQDKYIDVFFYNAGLSTAVGFEHLLTDSVRFADKIHGAFDSWSAASQAAIIATDGESYGHHEKNGDMCFSSFVSREILSRPFKLVNFGHFLEIMPPTFEVELKPGPNGEGTAWSCMHGVGRWARDCGCSEGGHYGWNQRWRTTFRESLDYLRNEAEKIYKDNLGKYVCDLKKMRNDYMDVLLDPSKKYDFLRKHLKDYNYPQDKTKIFKLLEAQFYCQLSFTSCGWFFADISRLEPTQNMKYAARAIEILSEFTRTDIESKFLNILDKAHSNITDFGSGKDIYNRFIKPCAYKIETIIANYAIENFILDEVRDRNIFFYTAKSSEYKIKNGEKIPLYKGKVKLINSKTDEEYDYLYYLFVPSYREIKCYILDPDIKIEFADNTDQIEKQISNLTNNNYFGLKNLICDNREHLIQLALKEELQKLEKTFKNIYHKNVDILETLTKYDLPLPNVLKEICSFALTTEFNKKIVKFKNLEPNNGTYKEYQKLRNLFLVSKESGLKINPSFIEGNLNEIIIANLNSLYNNFDEHTSKSTLNFINLAQEMDLNLDIFHMQNIAFRLLKEKILPIKSPKAISAKIECIKNLIQIAKKLSFNVQHFTKILDEN